MNSIKEEEWMIRMQIDEYVDELVESSYVAGLELIIESYKDKTIGVQVGSSIVEVDKKVLLKMIESMIMEEEED